MNQQQATEVGIPLEFIDASQLRLPSLTTEIDRACELAREHKTLPQGYGKIGFGRTKHDLRIQRTIGRGENSTDVDRDDVLKQVDSLGLLRLGHDQEVKEIQAILR